MTQLNYRNKIEYLCFSVLPQRMLQRHQKKEGWRRSVGSRCHRGCSRCRPPPSPSSPPPPCPPSHHPFTENKHSCFQQYQLCVTHKGEKMVVVPGSGSPVELVVLGVWEQVGGPVPVCTVSPYPAFLYSSSSVSFHLLSTTLLLLINDVDVCTYLSQSDGKTVSIILA